MIPRSHTLVVKNRSLIGLAMVILLLGATVIGRAGDRASAAALSTVGDVDCSGHTDSVDAAIVLQHIAGLVPFLQCPHNAPVDGYAAVTSIDATLILQYSAALVSQLPPIRRFAGTVVIVHGADGNCQGLDFGDGRLLFSELTKVTVGARVRVTGYIDPYEPVCGESPVLHNQTIEVMGAAP